jgi:hypothetical protein
LDAVQPSDPTFRRVESAAGTPDPTFQTEEEQGRAICWAVRRFGVAPSRATTSVGAISKRGMGRLLERDAPSFGSGVSQA